jgi:hypothetical protein
MGLNFGTGWNDEAALGNIYGYVIEYDPNTIIDIPGLVPEPETYAMLLAGLGLLGFMARRRKQ